MSLTLKPGTRLFSAVCDTQLIAVKAPADAVDLTIGGAPALTEAAPASGSVADGHGGGTLIGKRYVDDDHTIELLCTKAGDGLPALGGQPLSIKDAKPLPASD
ncbi:MAG: hypothetical protein ABWZ99_18780 [Ilumatobacteraceae bacterium]